MPTITRSWSCRAQPTLDDVVSAALSVRGETQYPEDTMQWAQWALSFLRGADRSQESAALAEASVESVAEPWIRSALQAAARCAQATDDGRSSVVYCAVKAVAYAQRAAGLPVTIEMRTLTP